MKHVKTAKHKTNAIQAHKHQNNHIIWIRNAKSNELKNGKQEYLIENEVVIGMLRTEE